MGWVYGQEQGAWSGPLLWSRWLSGSGTATPHRLKQIHITYIQYLGTLINILYINYLVYESDKN